MTRKTSLNLMAFVRARRLGALVPLLESEVELVGAPDDQEDGQQTPDLVEDVDVELLEKEYRADDGEDVAPSERVASFLFCHVGPPLFAVLGPGHGIDHELEPDDDDRDRPKVEQGFVKDDLKIGQDEQDAQDDENEAPEDRPGRRELGQTLVEGRGRRLTGGARVDRSGRLGVVEGLIDDESCQEEAGERLSPAP